jgi:hypothetical protein
MYFQGAARLQKPFITKYVNHPTVAVRTGALGGEGVEEAGRVRLRGGDLSGGPRASLSPVATTLRRL